MPKVSLELTGGRLCQAPNSRLENPWQFKQFPQQARRMNDLENTDWQVTTVPCSIFDSLMQAGLIRKEELLSNPQEFAYVSEKSWVFRKIFDAPDELMSCDKKELVFDGLDTVTNIWFNNKLIGRTNNMFIKQRFDVSDLVVQKNNSLVVKFEPAAEYADRLMNRYGRLGVSIGNPRRVYIRKAQFQFGWDFCPPLIGCGIWQDVRIEGVQKARLEDLGIRTIECNEHFADVKISVKLNIFSRTKIICKLTIAGNNQRIEQELVFKEDQDFHSTVIRIDKPALWWPAGYGLQNLYRIDIELFDDKEVLEHTQKEFGIRTVKLFSSNDSKNRRFSFEINGYAVYVKGANWVPASIFAGSVKAQDYDALLTAAADAGINMLRVWAGGYYETEDFYRLCDSLGIMVWQDFMFACAYYPDRSFFLKEVEKEASDVIKRLRNHPSLVLWCGNNEIDRMHYTGKLGQGKKFYGRDIYHKLLPKIVAELDADTPYIPTTPLGDDKSFKINNPLTTHRWDVWTGFRPVSDYIRSAESDSADIAEFVTEFGLQSMPAIKMVRNFCGEENFRISNIVVERHNYQTDGNSRLCRYISDLFGPAEEPEKFVYFSQLTQARAAKLYVEFLRANNNVNGGVLFWQLNDSFPAISWSAIDFNKEPKALYYYAKRFFSGLLLTAGRDDEQETITQQVFQPTKIILVNDTAEQITANVKCSLLDLGGNILDKVTFPISASPYKTARTMKLPRAISNPSNPADCMLHLLLEKDRVRKAENFFMYLPDKYINWPAAKIQHQLTKVSQGTWKLTIKTDVFIKDLQIRCPEIVSLSDNFFDILPATNKEIIVKADAKVQPFPRSETFNFDSVNNYLLI